MRVLGLNLLIAISLFGVAYVNSPRQEVVDAYRAFIQAHASGIPYATCSQQHPDTLDIEPGESREHGLEQCAEDHARYASNNPSYGDNAGRWQALLDASIVDVEIYSDGDHAVASPRVAGCTMEVLQLGFERADDGHWYEHTVVDGTEGPWGPCKEGGQIPPPELAWTWEGRQWR